MNFKRVTLECPNCGKAFSTEYHHGGSIEHENTLTNLGGFVRQWCAGGDKERLFLRAINLDGNHCNIKDNAHAVGVDIFKCVLLWMKRNQHREIYEYLFSRRHEIREKYNAVIYESIDQLEEDIDDLRSRLDR